MNILENKNGITYFEICQLTESLEWGARYYPTEALFKQVLNTSAHIAYIREKGALIGYGRVVTDGMHCMFYDICVHPAHQGKQIGTLIMRHLIEKIKDKNYVCIGLFCEDENKTVAEFYRKLGFENSQGMELRKYTRTNWD